MLRALAVLLLAMTARSGPVLADDFQSGRFVFSEWSGPPITVHYIEPPADRMADAPVVIVLHGVNRNADDYAANWRELARTYGLRIYAPEFSARAFPGAALYNLGGIGTDGPYAYTSIEPLFSVIAARGGAAEDYYLFSHSAGAQFVHRAILFEDLPRLFTAFSANAGWYTLPDLQEPWPYGLGGIPAIEDRLRRWLSQPLVLLLGDQDTNPGDPNLRQSPEAAAQGPHRYARGAFFMREAQARAQSYDMRLAWTAHIVPGVAHDNAGMAQAAARLIALESAQRSGRGE